MASSSRPSSATCSSLRCAAAGGRTVGLPDSASLQGRVLELPVAVAFAGEITDIPWCSSDFEVDGSGGCRDTRLDQLAGFAMDFPGAEVADLAGQERSEAAVADAHAAPAGHQDPGVLADIQDGGIAVSLHLPVGGLKGDQAAVVPYTGVESGVKAFDHQVAGFSGDGDVGAGRTGCQRCPVPEGFGVIQ